jgi:hypothetical protein
MTNLTFGFHSWRREISNFALFRYRDFDGFLVSGQNSGTQWLKFTLSAALAQHYGLPLPRYVNNQSSNDFIGHPKHPALYPELPRLASSHSIPHYLLDTPLIRVLLSFPHYVVLVRDIRAALVSHFEKWKGEYGVPFAEFLKGDPSGRRYWADVWWHIRFCNRWGRIAERYPEATTVVRYEELRRDGLRELARITARLELPLNQGDLDYALAQSTKEKMAARLDPRAKEQNIIRFDERDPSEWFSPQDEDVFHDILRAHLRYSFDYDYGI